MTIIRQQIIRNIVLKIIKIDLSTFIKNLVIDKSPTNYNLSIILIKAGSEIDMSKLDDYKEIDLQIYQYFISKLIYLVYGTKLDIVFVIN